MNYGVLMFLLIGMGWVFWGLSKILDVDGLKLVSISLLATGLCVGLSMLFVLLK